MADYEGYYADCYVLTNKRTKHFIQSFLNKFIPDRQEQADEYEIPQYSDNPSMIYKTADELIDHLEKNVTVVHTIYWSNNNKSEIKGAMCFFTNDGQTILGMSCETKYPDTTIEDNCLKDLMNFCDSTQGLI